MAYLIIPNANDQQSVSQGQIQTNFTELDAIFSVNHGGFVANNGLHTFIQMNETPLAGPGTAVDQGALFCAQGAISAVTELVFQRENTPGTTIAFTETVTTGTIAGNNLSGFTRLPSGVLLQWGSARITNAATGVTVTYKTPFLTQVFGVLVQEITAGGVTHNWFQVLQGSITLTQATITSKDGNGNASTSNAIYFALGI